MDDLKLRKCTLSVSSQNLVVGDLRFSFPGDVVSLSMACAVGGRLVFLQGNKKGINSAM